jgi:hypothetical protein
MRKKSLFAIIANYTVLTVGVGACLMVGFLFFSQKKVISPVTSTQDIIIEYITPTPGK